MFVQQCFSDFSDFGFWTPSDGGRQMDGGGGRPSDGRQKKTQKRRALTIIDVAAVVAAPTIIDVGATGAATPKSETRNRRLVVWLQS